MPKQPRRPRSPEKKSMRWGEEGRLKGLKEDTSTIRRGKRRLRGGGREWSDTIRLPSEDWLPLHSGTLTFTEKVCFVCSKQYEKGLDCHMHVQVISCLTSFKIHHSPPASFWKEICNLWNKSELNVDILCFGKLSWGRPASSIWKFCRLDFASLPSASSSISFISAFNFISQHSNLATFKEPITTLHAV